MQSSKAEELAHEQAYVTALYERLDVLRVATASLESYETFVSTQLGDVPGLDKLDSHLTMKLVKSPEPPGSASPRTGPTGRRR